MHPARLAGIDVEAEVTVTTESREVVGGLTAPEFHTIGHEQRSTLHGSAVYRGDLEPWAGITDRGPVVLEFDGQTYSVIVTGVVREEFGTSRMRGSLPPKYRFVFRSPYGESVWGA